MGQGYARIAFTPAVQAQQRRIGSLDHFAAMAEAGRDDSRLTEAEAAFLAERESFYMATANADGWPYMQHRGGPPGFVRVIEDGAALAFADLTGNRQHVSHGNLRESDKVALFFMDYANRRRLKLFGHAEWLAPEAVPDLATALPAPPRGRVQAVVRIRVAGFEWNCPQHIPQLLPVSVAQQLAERVVALEAEVERLRAHG